MYNSNSSEHNSDFDNHYDGTTAIPKELFVDEAEFDLPSIPSPPDVPSEEIQSEVKVTKKVQHAPKAKEAIDSLKLNRDKKKEFFEALQLNSDSTTKEIPEIEEDEETTFNQVYGSVDDVVTLTPNNTEEPVQPPTQTEPFEEEPEAKHDSEESISAYEQSIEEDKDEDNDNIFDDMYAESSSHYSDLLIEEEEVTKSGNKLISFILFFLSIGIIGGTIVLDVLQIQSLISADFMYGLPFFMAGIAFLVFGIALLPKK